MYCQYSPQIPWILILLHTSWCLFRKSSCRRLGRLVQCHRDQVLMPRGLQALNYIRLGLEFCRHFSYDIKSVMMTRWLANRNRGCNCLFFLIIAGAHKNILGELRWFGQKYLSNECLLTLVVVKHFLPRAENCLPYLLMSSFVLSPPGDSQSSKEVGD